jgi:excisionase family DNA binding protein
MSAAPLQPLPAIMTTSEVAALLRCSEETVARYVYSHQLAAIQIGRERRFRAEDVLDFIDSRPTTVRTGRS